MHPYSAAVSGMTEKRSYRGMRIKPALRASRELHEPTTGAARPPDHFDCGHPARGRLSAVVSGNAARVTSAMPTTAFVVTLS